MQDSHPFHGEWSRTSLLVLSVLCFVQIVATVEGLAESSAQADHGGLQWFRPRLSVKASKVQLDPLASGKQAVSEVLTRSPHTNVTINSRQQRRNETCVLIAAQIIVHHPSRQGATINEGLPNSLWGVRVKTSNVTVWFVSSKYSPNAPSLRVQNCSY